MDRAAQLLREFIALPSVNPAFLPKHDPHAGERRLAELLAATGAQAGLGVEFTEVLPHRSNVFLRLTPSGSVRQRVLLAPHLDTVAGELENDRLFTPQLKHGRMYGRGACDTKGSIAAMITALIELATVGQRPAHTEIVFAGLIDEECGQEGSRALVAARMRADLAIVGEPTRLRVVTAHKGSLWLSLETRGRAAHGARPELGRNAVHAMARVVDLLETRYAARLRRRRHPLLGCPTVSVGSIQGGTQANIVPDQCAITVDRRTLPGETEAGVRREMLAFLRPFGLRPRAGNLKPAPCWPLETDASQPLVREFLRVVGQSRPVGVEYFCDAGVLSAGGIPSIAFGPGDIAQAHTTNEWISVPSLERATGLLVRFLRSLP